MPKPRTHIGLDTIKRHVIEMESGTTYTIYPGTLEVQVVCHSKRDGQVLDHTTMNLDLFMDLMGKLVERRHG